MLSGTTSSSPDPFRPQSAEADPHDDATLSIGHEAHEHAHEHARVVARDRVWADDLRSDNEDVAQEALSHIMHGYADRLVRFAYGFVGSADAAEDVVQDVFVRLWDRRRTIRPEESVRAYLFTAVRRAALDLLKRRNVEARYVNRVGQDAAEPLRLTVDEQLDAEAIAREVRSAMSQLAERRRTALRLRCEEQLPFAVVAEIMELSEKAVKHLVTRAIEEIRERLAL